MANPQVKSATRAIEILEYFKLAQQPRSMSQIASDLGYPQSSTTVMLKTLVNLGYLNFDRSTRDYFPTPKLTTLGDWIPRVMFGSGQMIDALNDLHSATERTINPTGDWNTGRIVVDGNHVTHWLNDHITVEFELYSDEWEQLVAKSKFGVEEFYSRAPSGSIGLQDHGTPVWYRNMKIRPLNEN